MFRCYVASVDTYSNVTWKFFYPQEHERFVHAVLFIERLRHFGFLPAVARIGDEHPVTRSGGGDDFGPRPLKIRQSGVLIQQKTLIRQIHARLAQCRRHDLGVVGCALQIGVNAKNRVHRIKRLKMNIVVNADDDGPISRLGHLGGRKCERGAKRHARQPRPCQDPSSQRKPPPGAQLSVVHQGNRWW